MNKLSNKLVKIFDVTLRDGIQNLKGINSKPIFTHDTKLYLINQLTKANINQIEIGSNVSPKIIEMLNTQEIINLFAINKSMSNDKFCVLVPNYKKYIETLNWSNSFYINKYSLITACSEGFINKNTKMTFTENLEEIDKILLNTKNKFRLYVSCCFGCPIEGPTTIEHLDNLKKIINKYSHHQSIDEIVLSDTIGSYDMNQLDEYMQLYKSSNKISLHIHSDEHDKNIPIIIKKYLFDIVSIDTSLGNIGGCPNVEKKKIKPNLSTLTVAKIINDLESKQIYNIEELTNLETIVKDIIELKILLS